MIRFTNCLKCNHESETTSFANPDKPNGMRCPKCMSVGPFSTGFHHDNYTNHQASQSAASAVADVEKPTQEPAMAVEAPTKRRRGKSDESESEADAGEQLMLIDVTDPAHKPLISKLKKWRKIKLDRAEALKESKSAEDEAQNEVLGEMHALEMSAFRWDGHDFRIEDREKLVMKTARDEESGDGEE